MQLLATMIIPRFDSMHNATPKIASCLILTRKLVQKQTRPGLHNITTKCSPLISEITGTSIASSVGLQGYSQVCARIRALRGASLGIIHFVRTQCYLTSLFKLFCEMRHASNSSTLSIVLNRMFANWRVTHGGRIKHSILTRTFSQTPRDCQ